MDPPSFHALLMRFPSGTAGRLAVTRAAGIVGAAGVEFQFEPLFEPDRGTAQGFGIAGGGGREWHVARPRQSIAGAHPWEVAYQMASGVAALTGAAPDVVEPDLIQKWDYQ